jgi:hypothetical protein
MDELITENKKVLICGTSNKYQIKKLINREVEIKKRKISVKFDTISDEYLCIENQELLIKELFNDLKLKPDIDTIIQESINQKTINIIKCELNKKISSYKQQDIIRKLFDNDKFIDLNTLITKLFECNMKCYYCNENMFLLYEVVREMKQWSIDRINNDLGHNTDNIVMSCLECNLKRRRIGKDAFLFTKQMNIIKIV